MTRRSFEGFAARVRKECRGAASLFLVPRLEAAVTVEAAHPQRSRAIPARASLRVIPGGGVSPARSAPSRPSPIFSAPGPDPGFFTAFALALVPSLMFWAAFAFGVYALLR